MLGKLIKEILHKNYNKEEKKWLVLFLIIFILATCKYVLYGETYTFSTQNEEYDKVELNENIVSQTIIIDDNSSWNNNLWSVWFEFDENLKSQVACK